MAIIGQHLNTPPVAPSWHRPDCPPALEALILRLLEKDPAKRPASAAEVRAALWPTLQSGPAAAQSDLAKPPTARSPAACRRSAVSADLRRPRAGAAAAAARLRRGALGQGALADGGRRAGIGKTALCEQLATYVALRGGTALVGHCYEEGSLSLPYLPFVEAMRSYVLAREPEALRTDLGSGAAEVARIVSEVRDRAARSSCAPPAIPRMTAGGCSRR